MTLRPTDYPAGYASGEAKLSKNLIGSAKGSVTYASVDGAEGEATAQPAAAHHSVVDVSFVDAILNMVNNIAVNVLGGGEPETQGANRAVRKSSFFSPAFHLNTILHICLAGNVSSQQVNVTELSTHLETAGQTAAPHIPTV